jgi:beta-glucosidase
MNARFHILAIFAVSTLASWAAAQNRPVYKDETAPIDARVKDLLGRMTLEEKVAQLESMANLPSFGKPVANIVEPSGVNTVLAKQALGNGIGTFVFLEDIAGGTKSPRESAMNRNALQRWVIENTRLGIPVLFHGEALHGAAVTGATSFPEAVGLGSTWDRSLLKQMFGVVAQESRAVGNQLVLAPVLDLSRDPRYGRVEEMYSEDPYLTGELGVAAIRGLQGDDTSFDQNHVIATAKHFVHGQPENGTNVGPNDFSERTMREIFLYPFQQAVQVAHVGAVLPSYNENNGGIPSHANPWLLKQILRQEWGFTGITVSDYFGIQQLNTLQHVAGDDSSAATLAFDSGVDVELPMPSTYPSLVNAVERGTISEITIDDAVSRVLRLKFQAGLFEHPYVDVEQTNTVVGSKEHAQLERKVADEAIVLLKNENGILPLSTDRIKTLAVIGPNAAKARLGGYSGTPPYFATVLDGVRKRVGPGTKVLYAEGCRISEPDLSPSANSVTPYQAPSPSRDDVLIKEAIETARNADVVLLVLGGDEAVSRESYGDTGGALPTSFGDSDTLQLPGRQTELVNEVAKLGKPIVAVLLNGKAYSINELVSHAGGILEAWYLGQETGNAVAGVLFGDVNPSGHLPVTIARNVGQLPVYYYKQPAARRGYVFDDNTPLFPFGFGLSYTKFTFGKPAIDHTEIARDGSATVSVTVSNIGSRAGDDVVQLYVHHAVSSVVQAVLRLRGFQRIHLGPGESKLVSFKIGPEELAILDRQMKQTVEAGAVDILVGDGSVGASAVRLTILP